MYETSYNEKVALMHIQWFNIYQKYFNENIILSSNIKSRVLILTEIYEARETLLMMTACYFPQ